MSIRKQINAAVGERKLAYVPPTLGGIVPQRHLFMDTKMKEDIAKALNGDAEVDARLGGLVDDFNQYTTGVEITFGNDPIDKDIAAYMARTYPPQDGVIDIRSRDPRPAIRVFGCFAEYDVFVALHWKYRKALGDWNDRLFEQCVLKARGMWFALFPDYQPLYREDPHDLCSNIRIV